MNKSIYNNLLFYNIIIIISFITFKSKLYWYIIPISIFIFIILFNDKDPVKKQCLNNNINDPFLNLSNSNYTKLCKINPKKFFNFNLYTNYNDIFLNKNLDRQFYTMPNVFSPPYNKDISNWLYNTIDNCKNNSDYCIPYKDTRYH
jgi:hypothetical protein